MTIEEIWQHAKEAIEKANVLANRVKELEDRVKELEKRESGEKPPKKVKNGGSSKD